MNLSEPPPETKSMLPSSLTRRVMQACVETGMRTRSTHPPHAWEATAAGRAAVAASYPPPRVLSSLPSRSVAFGSACHVPAAVTAYERRCAGMHGMRHALNASTACMGGYSCWQGGCSRIIPTTTRAEQLATSIGRVWGSACHMPHQYVTTCPRDWWTNLLTVLEVCGF